MCVTVFTRFQLASTALTITPSPVPATCVVGVPVLPLPVPGAALSPGINTCSLAADPAENTMFPLVTGDKLMPAVALAVNVMVSALE